MSRATNAPASRERRRKWLTMAKGFVGGRRRLYRSARQAVERALAYSYRDRRQRKRAFRELWIIRINAEARRHGTTYSRLMGGLLKANVGLDRKVLAHLATNDPDAFSDVVKMAKAPHS
jgi:large subunit ribosomal protein L20